MPPENITPRASVLREAEELITGDRNVTYGSPTQNFANTAALLNIQFGHKLSKPFDAFDVAVMMMQLKLARLIAQPKRDTLTDIAGYAACGWEVIAPTEESAPAEEALLRQWPPGSSQPLDVKAVRSVENGIIFQARDSYTYGRDWVATRSSGGDGLLYSWHQINGLNAAEGPMTLIEVEETE